MVNAAVRDRLLQRGESPVLLDVAARSLDRDLAHRLTRLVPVTAALGVYAREVVSGRGNTLYVGLSGGLGQLLELPFVALARLRGARVFLHHHSFAYIDRTSIATGLLTVTAGEGATHIVLCETMACKLRERYPSVARVRVVPNAAMTASVVARERSSIQSIGFIGNISRAKGIMHVLAVARALAPYGITTRIAGPYEDDSVRDAVEGVIRELSCVQYEGPKYGRDKQSFFDSIDVLLFPSQYINEASPLVVCEAMSHGIPVIACERGCMSNIVSNETGLLVPRHSEFVEAAVGRICTWQQQLDGFRTASKAAAIESMRAQESAEHQVRELLTDLVTARRSASRTLSARARVSDAARSSWRHARTRLRQWQGTELRYQIEVDLRRVSLGTLNARWTYCPTYLDSRSIVYSVGVGTDISFDLALIEREGVDVHAFDPTPRACEWLARQRTPSNFHFYPWGLAGFDGAARFEPPSSDAHVSFSMVNQDVSDATIDCPVYRLQSLMQKLGHTRVDLLKMDIEGAELDVLPEILKSGVEVRQLLVEFHHRSDPAAMRRIEALLPQLDERGFRIFHVSPNAEEISWIRLP